MSALARWRNDLSRIVTLDEAGDIPESVGAWAAPFVVGFVLLSGRERQEATLGGSGTLIQADGKFGILTADHVLTNLPTQGEIGLVLPRMNTPKLDRHILDAGHLTYVRIGQASFSASGPDIGFVRLPEREARRLEVNKMFYGLSNRRSDMLQKPKPTNDGGWFLSGMVHEWTEEHAGEVGYHAVKQFRGTFGAGVVSQESRDDRFDYLKFEARFGDRYEGPTNYQGTSGGGLWQVALTERDGALVIRDVLLSGVAFYQTLVPTGFDISCHGRSSVYDAVHEALAQT